MMISDALSEEVQRKVSGAFQNHHDASFKIINRFLTDRQRTLLEHCCTRQQALPYLVADSLRCYAGSCALEPPQSLLAHNSQRDSTSPTFLFPTTKCFFLNRTWKLSVFFLWTSLGEQMKSTFRSPTFT
jgi:hypothetical protein